MQTERRITPTAEDIARVWRADRCLSPGTAIVYMQSINLFRAYCVAHGLVERDELTLEGVNGFIAWYARQRQLKPRSLNRFRSALQSLHRVYRRLGLAPADWCSPPPARQPATPLLAAYADYLRRHRGHPQATVHKKLDHIGQFQDHRRHTGEDGQPLDLVVIDAFLVGLAPRYARSTVSAIACSLRCFLRFLHWSGRLPVDLSDAVIAPVQPRYERPPRALAWDEVQRLLNAVDRSTPTGRRDYALLLMMSLYGLGAGEARGLQFQDIDWDAGTVSVVRPKTGTAFILPLLPAVAEAVARYLRHGRPIDTPTRHLFVCMKIPFEPLTSSSAIRHIIVKQARRAGITAPFLGSHVLRHTHAARQIDLGTPPRVISELLGHRDPESLSAYVRIATQTLREIARPVPT